MEPSSTDEIASLSDLLRTLGEEARSCWVRVTDGEREGSLHFEHGELVEIVFGQLRGASAMFALMEASGVRYEVLDTLVPTRPDSQQAEGLEGAPAPSDVEAANQELRLYIDEAAMTAWMAARADPGVAADAAGAERASQAEDAASAPSALAEGKADLPQELQPEGADALGAERMPEETSVDGEAPQSEGTALSDLTHASVAPAGAQEPLEPAADGATAQTSEGAAGPLDASDTSVAYEPEEDVPTSSQTQEAQGNQPLARTPADEPQGAANERPPSSESFAPKAVGARRSDWPRAGRPRQRKLATSTLLGIGAAALLAALMWRPAREAVRPRAPEHDVTSGTAGTRTRLGEPSQPTGVGVAATGTHGAGGLREQEVPEWIEGPAPEAPQGTLVPTIVLRVLVGTDGQVRKAEVDSPRPALAALEQKALETARNHRFHPAMRAGTPIEAWTTLPLSFDPSVVERTLVVQGSDVLASGLGRAWAAAVERARPGLRVRREGFGSRGGLAALLRGHGELALATRPLEATELVLADKLGLSLRELLAGYDGVAVITHPDNPVRDLDLATLAKIYTREVTQWSELHGASAPIRVLGKPSYAAARAYFQERVLATLGGEARFGEDIEVVESSDDVVARVAADVHAIGYVSLSHVNPTVRALGLRRDAQAPAVVPGAGTLRDESYPLARPLLFYLRSDAGADARALVEVAFSKAGQAALLEHGLMPRPSAETLSLEPAYAAAPATRPTPHPIYFQPGGALLAKGAWSQLRALGTALGASKRALVVGNTDSTGSAEVNTRIAERRAQLVAAVLRQYSPDALIELENASSGHPLATNTTPEGRDVNRRVDVFLMPR